MDPMAENAGHRGLMQWNKSRQADFAKLYGYQMGSNSVVGDKQFKDQTLFALEELQTTQREAASAVAKARTLLDKTSAIMMLDERPGDSSLSQRFSYAEQALKSIDAAKASAGLVQHNVTSETHIGEVNVHTPATDPKSHVSAVAEGLTNHPLMNPAAQGTVSLATRGMVQ
jgi:riboflavin synthase